MKRSIFLVLVILINGDALSQSVSSSTVDQERTPNVISSENTLAIVNGTAIPLRRHEALVQRLISQGQIDTPELRALCREELINREVLIQEAERLGLTKTVDVIGAIDIATESLLVQAFTRDYYQKHKLTDLDEATRKNKLSVFIQGIRRNSIIQ